MQSPYSTIANSNQSDVQSLSQAESVDSTLRPIPFIKGHNLGNTTLLISLPIDDFLGNSFIPNEANIAASAEMEGQPIAQRPLSIPHATGLAQYLLKGMLFAMKKDFESKDEETPDALDELIEATGLQSYMALQPIVVNLRGFNASDLQINKERTHVFFGKKHTLWIIDGQHRYKGMEMLNEYIDGIFNQYKYPKRPDLIPAFAGETVTREHLDVWESVRATVRGRCTVMIEVHLGLGTNQERQLFHDLNNHGKKVESSLAYSFDESNPVNMYIKERLEGEGRIFRPVLVDKDIKTPSEDQPPFYTRKEMVGINSILFLSKTSPRNAQPSKIAKFKNHADEFWRMIDAIPGVNEADARRRTTAACPVMIKAIAKLYNRFLKPSKDTSLSLNNLDQAMKLTDGICSGKIDFSQSNPLWRYFLLPEGERDELFPGLRDYFPKDENGQVTKRDLGKLKDCPYGDGKMMAFSKSHNDVYPILGDMIRWSLGLSVRGEKQD